MTSNLMIQLNTTTKDVSYTIVADPANAFKISNVKFYPPPPIEVNTVDTIKLTYDYQASFGGIKIFAWPTEMKK